MKKIYNTLVLALITTVSFAQGISVQGIARDNASSAITDTNLTFTFSIVKQDNVVLFAETQNIKTDNFGVFSHIVGSGNPTNNTFSDVNFGIKNLKLKVAVNYESSDIEVYDQPFQYTPYAHFAGNGVPTGSIMPYSGAVAPAGWVICNGQDLTGMPRAAALIELVGNNAPDLQGMFLRGTGTSPKNGKVGPALNTTQGDDNKSHNHYNSLSGNTTTTGGHNHTMNFWTEFDGEGDGGYRKYGPTSNQDGTAVETTDSQGNHNHSVSVTGYSNSSGGTESRPVNYGVNYIIKL